MRRILLITGLSATSLGFVLVQACTGDNPATSDAGQYHQPCLSDGTCIGALVCSGNVCLNPGEVPNDGGNASSSSGGGSSSGGSSSGSSGNDSAVDSGCNSPFHGDGGGVPCGSSTCEEDGGLNPTSGCCRSTVSPPVCNAGGTCVDPGTYGGLWEVCDGPRVCGANRACCIYKSDAATSFDPVIDAGTVACGKRLIDARTIACSGGSTCGNPGSGLQVCDKNDLAFQACGAGTTCTTVEVAIGDGGTFMLDVCMP